MLPDMLTFTPDGSKILVANEARSADRRRTTRTAPSASSTCRAAPPRPPSRPPSDSPRSTAAKPRSTERSAFPCSQARALRPTSSPNTSRSRRTARAPMSRCRRSTRVAVIDLTNPTATSPLAILPLGSIDRSLAGNQFDPSDQDGDRCRQLGGPIAAATGCDRDLQHRRRDLFRDRQRRRRARRHRPDRRRGAAEQRGPTTSMTRHSRTKPPSSRTPTSVV